MQTQTLSGTAHEPEAARRKNLTALSVTIGLHLLVLLLLLIWKYTPPIHIPIQEEGIEVSLGEEVNLGTGDEGMGNDQPEEPGVPASAAAATMPEQQTEDGVQTDDNAEADAPEVAPKPKPKTAKPAPTPTPATPTPTPAPRTAKYTFDGADGPGGNGAQNTRPGSGEGITGKPGDQGRPGGTPGAPNYTGNPGPGTGGIGHNLSNRKIVAFPPKEAEFRTGGKVVVRVTVNRAGNIVASRIISAPNNELRNIALQKVRGGRFTKSDDAPVEQFGDITINFKSR